MHNNIRQLCASDFEEMYQIWEVGLSEAFTNLKLTISDKVEFSRWFLSSALDRQDNNFKIWGYFHSGVLQGWQALLPCQSAPVVWTKFAESSTYVDPGSRSRGVGRSLLTHAIADARTNSELAYIMGYISEGNTHVQKLVTDVGFHKVGVLPKSSKDNVLGALDKEELIHQANLCQIGVWVVAL